MLRKNRELNDLVKLICLYRLPSILTVKQKPKDLTQFTAQV